MGITGEHFKKIEHILPVQRGNVRHDNLAFLIAVPRVLTYRYITPVSGIS